MNHIIWSYLRFGKVGEQFRSLQKHVKIKVEEMLKDLKLTGKLEGNKICQQITS
jgi:hypothetical protein